MKQSLSTKVMLLLALALTTGMLQAQVMKIIPASSSITIQGTSNLHDWKSKAEQVSGQMVLSGDNKLNSLAVEIPVNSIKSGERLMDSKTMETFNAKKHPNISFRMTEVSQVQMTGTGMQVSVTGNLTMSGTTRKVTVKANGKQLKPGTYVFNGDLALKMTDFGMKPPTALLGAMKVGDGIKLAFDVTMVSQEQASNE